jgi:predicted ester cyclase
MSQENLALTCRAFDASNRHDWDGFLRLMHQEVEAGSRQVAIEGGYHAHQGLRRWWTDLFEAFPDYTAQVQELRDLGECDGRSPPRAWPRRTWRCASG